MFPLYGSDRDSEDTTNRLRLKPHIELDWSEFEYNFQHIPPLGYGDSTFDAWIALAESETVHALENGGIIRERFVANVPNDPLPQARQLPRLPPFCYGRHDNDRYGGYRGRNHAAVIFADKKDGNNAVFGTFGTASAFQFSPKPFATCPTFGILVHAGYRTSADNGRFARKADNPKPRSRMYVSESNSRDSNRMSEDFVQGSLEFDCDVADWFTSEIVETLDNDVKSRIEQSGITMRTGRSVRYGMLVY